MSLKILNDILFSLFSCTNKSGKLIFLNIFIWLITFSKIIQKGGDRGAAPAPLRGEPRVHLAAGGGRPALRGARRHAHAHGGGARGRAPLLRVRAVPPRVPVAPALPQPAVSGVTFTFNLTVSLCLSFFTLKLAFALAF